MKDISITSNLSHHLDAISLLGTACLIIREPQIVRYRLAHAFGHM